MRTVAVNPGLTCEFIARRAMLRAIAQRVLGCRQRAEDVVQDAFLKLLESTHVPPIKQSGAYLTRLVRNLAIDHCRRAAFESQWFLDEDNGGGVATETAELDQQLCHSESVALVENVLAGLPARSRKALVMNRIEGLTQREVARRLSVSPTLVNFMIRDALAYCQPRLAARG